MSSGKQASSGPEAVRKRIWRKNKQLMQEDHDFLEEVFYDCLEEKPKPGPKPKKKKIQCPGSSEDQAFFEDCKPPTKKRKIDHHLSLDGLDRVHKKLQPPAKKIRLDLDDVLYSLQLLNIRVWNEKNGNK